jgi:plasmid stabilization system protein ParE
MNLTIDETAQHEARAHVAYYAERNPQVAARLAELFVGTIERVVKTPRRFGLMEGSRREDVRRARL